MILSLFWQHQPPPQDEQQVEWKHSKSEVVLVRWEIEAYWQSCVFFSTELGANGNICSFTNKQARMEVLVFSGVKKKEKKMEQSRKWRCWFTLM